MMCDVEKDLTTIHHSYLMNDKEVEKLIDEMIKGRKKKKYKVTRSKVSYVREVKAHNRLYNLGLFESHTMHSDLEENIVWWKEIVYFIIGFQGVMSDEEKDKLVIDNIGLIYLAMKQMNLK